MSSVRPTRSRPDRGPVTATPVKVFLSEGPPSRTVEDHGCGATGCGVRDISTTGWGTRLLLVGERIPTTEPLKQGIEKSKDTRL